MLTTITRCDLIIATIFYIMAELIPIRPLSGFVPIRHYIRGGSYDEIREQ